MSNDYHRPPAAAPPAPADGSRHQQPSADMLPNTADAPPTSPAPPPTRPPAPTRSSTLGSERSDRRHDYVPMSQAKSEDLSHSAASSSRLPYGSLPKASNISSTPPNSQSTVNSHPSTPSFPDRLRLPSSNSPSDDESDSRLSYDSDSSSYSQPKRPPTVSSTSTTLTTTCCSACGKSLQGPLVRALGTVFHLNCFKCLDCGDVVASKFFPIDGPEGKQQPLCERDYFRRLNLICAKCGMALRASYITACNKKFHVEHFTCSLCPTLFGPQDSYYEHDGEVYCHFHYSTRFATKCAGCNSAILKQFVEINRNSRDECWHPECYMINKFWNVKVVSPRPSSIAALEGDPDSPLYLEEEQRETAESLKAKQARMEEQVYRIWTVLSAFEESSAACISDMLRQVSSGQYLEAIRMAEKFILHVEVLFATMDDLEFTFSRLNLKGMPHGREARMLCRKTVELFGLLSDTQETGARRMGMTQELLALITGLAHYLKILIRIALTGALRLEREHSVPEAMSGFLDKLRLLAVQGGNPSARRLLKGTSGETYNPISDANTGTQGVTYGFKSLAPEIAGDSPYGSLREGSSKPPYSNNPPSDLCIKCNGTVEEDCVRLGTYQRWHSQCIQCAHCGKVAAVPTKEISQSQKAVEDKDQKDGAPPKQSTVRRPPANVGIFVYDPESRKTTTAFGEVPTAIYCTEHAHSGCRPGFQAVSRLEQYAFLLNVALRRLYLMLKKQGVLPLSPVAHTDSSRDRALGQPDTYRNSTEILKMKSVNLARKHSANAQLPKRSTVVESPEGRSVHPTDSLHTQKSHDARHAGQQAHPMSPQSHSKHRHQHQHHHQQQQHQPRSPPMPGQQTPTLREPRAPQLAQSKSDPQSQQHVIRPAFARNNTEVMIVDDTAPNSPAGGREDPMSALDDGITLADIPQIIQQQNLTPSRNSTNCRWIAELSPQGLAIVKHAAVALLYRSVLRDQFDLDEILEMVEVKKSGFWNKFFKTGGEKKIKKKGVFGVPLELLVERDGADCMLGASATSIRVPSFIDDVISAMRQMDMSIEGIFRRNGNIRRLKDLTEAIDRDPASVDLTQDNPVQLAALLKKFFRDLPDPLMTFKLHKLLIASQGEKIPEPDQQRLLNLIALIMPKSHRDTMEVLFVFLKWVASFAHTDEENGSKMDLGNLATVICPSILSARGNNAADDSFGAIRVITELLENQDMYFTVPLELMSILGDQEIFSNYMDLPGKDLMKKCDTYLTRVKGQPRPHGPPGMEPQNGTMARMQMSPVLGPDTRLAQIPGLSGAHMVAGTPRPHPGMPPPVASMYPSPASPGEAPYQGSPFVPSRPPPPMNSDLSWSQQPSHPPGPNSTFSPAMQSQTALSQPRPSYAQSSNNNNNNNGSAPSSRPSSVVQQSRPSGEYSYSPQMNGNSAGPRQR